MDSSSSPAQHLVFSPEEVEKRTLQVIERLAADPLAGIQTGIETIDAVLLPMRPPEFIGVVGYTSNFKTGFINHTARFNARVLQAKQDYNGVVISFDWEHTIEEKGLVDMAQMAGLDITALMRGTMPASEIEQLKEAGMVRGGMPWWLVGHSSEDRRRRPRMTMTAVKNAMAWLVDKCLVEPKLITLDYLQRIKREKKDLREGYMDIVDNVKDLANEFHVPVMIGCQAKRDVARRKNKMPQADDAQETSNFEQTSDKYLSLLMPKNFYPENHKLKHGKYKYTVNDNLLLLQVTKQKFGPAPRTVPLYVKPGINEILPIDLGSLEKNEDWKY